MAGWCIKSMDGKLMGDQTEQKPALEQELKTAKKQLRQSAKLAAIGQLSAGIAHEINNPVGYVHSNLTSLHHYITDLLVLTDAIAGAASADELRCRLRAIDYDFLRTDIHDLMSESLAGLDRVREIVHSMKTCARSDDDLLKLADPLEGLESTLNIVRNEVKYRAELHVDVKPLPKILCIPAQINQVLLNLIVNAAQAIPDYGRIHLRSGSDALGVWIEVQDDGSGISADHLEHLFEPFFTTKPEGQGTGLGLSVSQEIVQRHGGRLTVDSQLGEGSRFRVWLPLQAARNESS